MNIMPTPLERGVLAGAAALMSAFAISSLTSSFLPADPRVGIARQQAVLERVERARESQRAQQARLERRPNATIIL